MLRRSVSLMLGAASLGLGVAAHAGPSPVKAPSPSPSVLGTIALAIPSTGAKPAPKPVYKPKKPAPPPLPAPQIELRIEPRPANGWLMSVRNAGPVPVELVADARLLRFELAPRPSLTGANDDAPKPKTGGKNKQGKQKADDERVECALPASMRSDARRLVLPPGARYLEAFDPRLYCLDRASKLGEGASVFARLGWAPPKSGKLSRPFVVAPETTGAPATVGSAKELVAPPVVVLAKSSVVGSLAPPSKVDVLAGAPLVVRPGGARSFFGQKDVQLTVQLRNESAEPRVVYARPQLVGAQVRAPNGTVTVCDGWARPAPIVDFVVHVPPKGEWTATVGLDDLCPPGTFDRPGLYEVTPTLHADPIPWEPKAVTGALVADTPALVRIEEGSLPFHDVAPLALETSE